MNREDYISFYRPRSFQISTEYCMRNVGNPYDLQSYWVGALDNHFELVIIHDKHGNLILIK